MSWATCPLLLVPELLQTAKTQTTTSVRTNQGLDAGYTTTNTRTNLSDFLDLAATLADEGATLACRHDEAHGDRGFAGGCAVSH